MIAIYMLLQQARLKLFAPISLWVITYALKANGYFNFVPFSKELCETQFRFSTLIDNWAQTNFFHGHNALLCVALFVLLVLKFELTVVHNFSNRQRFCLGVESMPKSTECVVVCTIENACASLVVMPSCSFKTDQASFTYTRISSLMNRDTFAMVSPLFSSKRKTRGGLVILSPHVMIVS